jgi:hypothetical protein
MLFFNDSKARFSAIFLALTAACTPLPEWTRERQTLVTTRTFSSASPQQIERAAEQVLKLADRTDVTFEYRPGGFRAARTYGAYFVIGAVMGTYYFEFQSLPAGKGTKAEMRIYSDSTSFTSMGPIPANASLWQLEGAYALFFQRLQSVLDSNTPWVTCAEAPKALGQNSTHFEPLCVSATDSRPK